MNLKSRSRLRLALVVPALTLALSGCPLVSDYPLSEPLAASIDARLLGAWERADPDTGKPTRLRFEAFDEHQLVGIALGEPDDEISALRAFTTAIGAERFLNVREVGRGSSGWYILRYSIEGDALAMASVDDALFEGRSFAGAAQLHEFVRGNLANPALYGASGEDRQEMVWRRAANGN
jgi:hypothetical protein